MDIFETKSSKNEDASNQLLIKSKKQKQEKEENSIFPKEFMTLNRLYTLKDQLNNITFEKEGKYLLQKLYFSEDDKKLYKLLLIKGVVPPSFRPEFWYISSGAKRECQRHPGYYKFLCEKYPYYKNSIKEEIEIEKDIKRSFPEETFFKSEENLDKFRRTLNSYYKRNLSGYTQGCNQIVGRMLETIGNEEKTFWVFSQLMENILTVDYFSRMLGLFTDIDIVTCLLRDLYLPDLMNHLENKKKSSGLQLLFDNLVKWFVTLFISNFPKKFQLLIWDLLFLDKKIVLYKVSIGLWQKYKNQISQLDDIESFVNFTKNLSTDFNDENFLKYILFIKNFEFDDDFINSEKKIIIQKKIILEKQLVISRIETEKTEQNLCNINWPTCIYDINPNKEYSDVIVYCQLDKCEIIEDYFKYEENKKNKYLKNRKFVDLRVGHLAYKNLNYNNILIQRRNHVCYKYNKNTKYDVKKDIKNEIKNNNKINIENDSKKEEEEDYIEKRKKYKQIRYRKIVSNYYNNYQKLNLNDKNENNVDDLIDEEDDILAKYLSKEFINYSKYRIDNLRLSKLPSKIDDS